eukprot:764931-Hanusia_phi.AAC.6
MEQRHSSFFPSSSFLTASQPAPVSISIFPLPSSTVSDFQKAPCVLLSSPWRCSPRGFGFDPIIPMICRDGFSEMCKDASSKVPALRSLHIPSSKFHSSSCPPFCGTRKYSASGELTTAVSFTPLLELGIIHQILCHLHESRLFVQATQRLQQTCWKAGLENIEFMASMLRPVPF